STITWNPPVVWAEWLAVTLFLGAFLEGGAQLIRPEVLDQRVACALVNAGLVERHVRAARKRQRRRGQQSQSGYFHCFAPAPVRGGVAPPRPGQSVRLRVLVGRLPAPRLWAAAALQHALAIDVGDHVAVTREQRLGRTHLRAQRQLAF